SHFLLDEMADFESNHDLAQAKVKVGKGHDDRILALLIGYFGAHDDEWLNGEDIAEERRLRLTAGKQQEELIAAEEAVLARPGRIDYQNQPISASKMWEHANDWLLDD